MESRTPKLVSETIQSAKKILIVTHSRPSIDALASIAVLYAIIKNNFKKEVDVAIPTVLGERAYALLGNVELAKERVLQDLPPRTYTIKIKKQGEKIESLSYNDSGDTFNFVLSPFNGVLDLKSIAVTEEGASYDLIITIDTASLKFLGEVYKQNSALFDATPIISFDNHRKSSAGYAKYSVTYEEIDTASQLMLRFLQDAQIALEEVHASILFAGISSFLNLGMKEKVRTGTYTDLAKLLEYKANLSTVHKMLYAPTNINEIMLIGDILASINEGTSEKLGNKKVVSCKVTLNKEEVDHIDTDKVAQTVFWNTKLHDAVLGIVTFQKSQKESVTYLCSYDNNGDISTYLQTLQGRGDRFSGKILFECDMNEAEARVKDVLGIMFTINPKGYENIPGPIGFEDEGLGSFDDFYTTPSQPAVSSESPIFQPGMETNGSSSTVQEEKPQSEVNSKDDKAPTLFDPRKA